MSKKPLSRKAYGSIGHLPGSRLGPGDHHVPEGQARICTEKVRDKHDLVIVQHKYDGSCCAVANVDGRIVALTRAGYLASTSRYHQHWLFAAWVLDEIEQFRKLLAPGERVVGEWVAQAHGTVYHNVEQPFIPFDIFDTNNQRLRCADVWERLFYRTKLKQAQCLRQGNLPVSVEEAMDLLDIQHVDLPQTHQPEGVVYRVERHGRVDFLAKYVRPNKQDGIFLPEISGCQAVWNWGPLQI